MEQAGEQQHSSRADASLENQLNELVELANKGLINDALLAEMKREAIMRSLGLKKHEDDGEDKGDERRKRKHKRKREKERKKIRRSPQVCSVCHEHRKSHQCSGQRCAGPEVNPFCKAPHKHPGYSRNGTKKQKAQQKSLAVDPAPLEDVSLAESAPLEISINTSYTAWQRSVLILNRSEVARLLTVEDCASLMGNALSLFSSGQIDQPERMALRMSPHNSNIFGLMPAVWTGQCCGVKAITVCHGSGADSHRGFIMLFSLVDGSPMAIMDASQITGIRTAAVSSVATSRLARQDLEEVVCAILGSGVQARTHLAAMYALLKPRLKKVRVWSRTSINAASFVEEYSKLYPDVEFACCTTAQEAVEDADIINTVTSSPTPVVQGSWVKPGAHINAVGSCTPTTRELASDVMANATIFVDSKHMALKEAGDICIPISEGIITQSNIKGEVGHILNNQILGRESTSEITLFKSLGLAAEDLVAAVTIYDKAKAIGIGTWLEI